MSYFFRQTQMAKGWGKEINAAWDEADHPRGKTTEGSNSGSFAPKGSGGEGVAGLQNPERQPGENDEQYIARRIAGEIARDNPGMGADEAKAKEQANFEAAVNKERQRSYEYKNPHGDKIGFGSIVYESWGYDQTNINFYEVTGMSKSGKTVTLREVAATGARDKQARGPMDDYKRAIPGKYIGEPFTRRVSQDGKSTSGKYKHSAGLWGGDDLYYSWYH